MKKAKQLGKELALDIFKWQVRFLPMPQRERDHAIEAQQKGLGLDNKKGENKWKKGRINEFKGFKEGRWVMKDYFIVVIIICMSIISVSEIEQAVINAKTYELMKHFSE